MNLRNSTLRFILLWQVNQKKNNSIHLSSGKQTYNCMTVVDTHTASTDDCIITFNILFIFNHITISSQRWNTQCVQMNGLLTLNNISRNMYSKHFKGFASFFVISKHHILLNICVVIVNLYTFVSIWHFVYFLFVFLKK